MFEITRFIEARLATLTPRSERHGDEEKPAVSIGIEIETGNSILDLIDKTLRPTLYTKPEGQESLPGVEDVLQVLRCNSIDRVVLPTKHEGWTLHVDYGVDERQTMAFGGCTLAKFSVEPLQGGSIVLRLRINTSDLDAERSGYLGMHVGQPIWITLTAPRPGEVGDDGGQQDRAPHADASDLFTGDAGDDESKPEGAAIDPGAADAQSEGQSSGSTAEGSWPFPRGGASDEQPPQAVVTEAKPRTRRSKQAAAVAQAAGDIE